MAERTTKTREPWSSSDPQPRQTDGRKQLPKGDTHRPLFQDPNTISEATWSKLDYRIMEYCRTKHYNAALRCLDNHGSVTLIGPPGAGKTTLACELLRQARHKGSTVLAAETPRDVVKLFRKSDEEVGKTLVLVDAILGESGIDVTKVEEWQETLAEVDLRLRLWADLGKGHVFQFVFTLPSVDHHDDVEMGKLLKAHSVVRQEERIVDLTVWDDEDKIAVFRCQGDMWEEDPDDPDNSFERIASVKCSHGFPLISRLFFRERKRISSIEEFFSRANSPRAVLEDIVKTDPESALVLAMVVLSDNNLEDEVLLSSQQNKKPGDKAAAPERLRGQGILAKRVDPPPPSAAASSSSPASSPAASSNGVAAVSSLVSRVQKRVEAGVCKVKSWLDRRLHSSEEDLHELHVDAVSLLDKALLLLSLDLELTPELERKAGALASEKSILSHEGGRYSFCHPFYQDTLVDILQLRDRETLACLCSRDFLHYRVLVTGDPQLRSGRVHLNPSNQGLLVDRLVDYISRRFYHLTCSHPNLQDPAIAEAVFSGLRQKKVLKAVLTSPDVEGHGTFLACCVGPYPSALFAVAFDFCRKSRKLCKACLHPRALAHVLHRCCVYDNVAAFDVVDKFLGSRSFRDMRAENPGLGGIADLLRQLMRLGLSGSSSGDSPGDDKPRNARRSGEGNHGENNDNGDDNNDEEEEEGDLFCGKPCCQTLASLAVLHRSHQVLERMTGSFLNTLTQGQTRDALYLSCATNNARTFALLVGRPLGLCRYPLVQLIVRAGADDVMEWWLSELETVGLAEEDRRNITDFSDGRGRTPLMVAAHLGHGRLVELLLPQSDVNARDESGFTALMLASFRGSTHVVQALLPVSDVALRDNFGRTALHTAAARGHVDVVQSLIRVSNPNLPSSDGDSALAVAACYGLEDTVSALIPVSDCSLQNARGRTALHLAAMHGHAGVVRLLLPHSDAGCVTERGRTALQMAATNGHVDVVLTLLPTSDPNHVSKDGMNALELAAIQGHDKVVEVLLPHTDLRHSDGDGNTALHLTAYFGHVDTVRVLLAACDASLQDKEARTPLQVAATHGYDEIVRLLLPVSDPRHQDREGETALSMAVSFSHTAVVQSLLPASDVTLTNTSGQTPLHLAALCGHLEIARLLLPASDPSRQDAQGDTALTLAYRGGDLDLIRLLLPVTDPGLAGSHGLTALHIAAECGSLEMVLALAPKSDPLRGDVVGRTPLHVAVWAGRVEVVEALLPLSQPSQTDAEGRTALHLASFCGHAACVRLLLPVSDARLPDREGNSPLHLAALRGHACVVALLLPCRALPGMTRSPDPAPPRESGPESGVSRAETETLPATDVKKTASARDADPASLQDLAPIDASSAPSQGSAPDWRGSSPGTKKHTTAEAEKTGSTTDANSSPLQKLAPASRDSNPEAERQAVLDEKSHALRGLSPETDRRLDDDAEKITSPCNYSRLEEEKDDDSPYSFFPADDLLGVRTDLDLVSDPLHRNKDGLTALELAARAGHYDVIAMLLPFCKGEAAWSAYQLVLRHQPGSCALGVFHGFVPHKRQPPRPPPSP